MMFLIISTGQFDIKINSTINFKRWMEKSKIPQQDTEAPS